jgi:hypothetical protein
LIDMVQLATRVDFWNAGRMQRSGARGDIALFRPFR